VTAAGALYPLLAVANFALTGQTGHPPLDAAAGVVAEALRADAANLRAAAYLDGLGAVLLAAFALGLARSARDRSPHLANLVAVGGVAVAAVDLVWAATQTSAADLASQGMDAALVKSAYLLSLDLLTLIGVAQAALFVGIGVALLRDQVFPAWACLIGVAIGLVALLASPFQSVSASAVGITFLAYLASLIWIFVVAIAVGVRSRRSMAGR
jgi:hypothetical protein